MANLLELLTIYAGIIVSIFYVLDKVVKITPTEKYDMIVDMILRPLIQAVGLISKEDDTNDEDQKSEEESFHFLFGRGSFWTPTFFQF